MGPFKCPDCGVWWAGVEHRCPPGTSAAGVPVQPTPPSFPPPGIQIVPAATGITFTEPTPRCPICGQQHGTTIACTKITYGVTAAASVLPPSFGLPPNTTGAIARS